MDHAIEISAVSKTFILPHEKRDTLKENFLAIFKKKTFEKFKALDNVTLKIRKGEFFGIVGKNGSGKSTLLKVVAGIYCPDQGEVKVNGVIAPFLELGIGFQEELTGRENIFINAALLGLSRKETKERFNRIVEFAELEKFLDLKIKNYSSGMRARLAFAIAKEADADIYLCDEILAVGDEQFQRKCVDVFRHWQQQGKTVVLVSHNAGLIEDFCLDSALIDNGRLIMSGTTADILAEYRRRIAGDRQHQSIAKPNFSDSLLRLKEVRFYGADEDEKDAFNTGETIVARIFYKAYAKIENPVFGIAIHKKDGTHIAGPNTKTSLYPIAAVEGDGYIDCVISNNSLLAGQYDFTASCFDYSCRYPYDYLDRKFQFTILRNRDNQYGLVELPVTWRLSKVEKGINIVV
jgi:ABC-type polysaccharide/polyol phosphate transport system ATPase subunit